MIAGGVICYLYGHPWWEYQVCGYRCFWVSRPNEEDLSGEELAQLETEGPEDLRFDYSENELGFWFDDSAVEGVLQVTLQDLDVCEDEDEKE